MCLTILQFVPQFAGFDDSRSFTIKLCSQRREKSVRFVFTRLGWDSKPVANSLDLFRRWCSDPNRHILYICIRGRPDRWAGIDMMSIIQILLVYLHISMRKNMSAPSNVYWMGNPTWTTKPNPPKKLKLATSTKYGITEKRQDTHKHHRWKNNLYIYSKTIRATVFMCVGKD